MSGWSGLVPAAPEWLLLLPLALVAAWLELRAGRPRARAALRAALVALLVLAASRPTPLATSAPLAMVVDVSASVDEGASQQLLDRAARGAAARVFTFGDADETNLEAAIDLGIAALPQGGRLLLATDGRATKGRAIPAAERARRTGVTVDALQLPARAAGDAAVVAVEAPRTWRAGDPVPVAITVAATQPLSTSLSLYRGTDLVGRTPVALEAGMQVVPLVAPMPPTIRGEVALTAEVEGASAGEPGNDRGYALVRLAGPPEVLVVGDGMAGVALADHLAREGVPAAMVAPERAPVGAAEWARYDTVALVDVPAARMTAAQLEGLDRHVRAGAGLLLTGGRQSFALGGWDGTVLADLSPLLFEAPESGDRAPVTLVLVVDKSASMAGAAVHPSVTKLDVAREAAALAVEALAPGDQVGVVAYSDEPQWVAPMQQLAGAESLLEVRDQLAGLAAEGGTRILPALQAGIDAAASTTAQTRHVLLLSDGQDASPDQSAFDAAAAGARQRGVTLSTIALGEDADGTLLARLAEIGRGRAHLAADPAALPRLTLEESRMVAGRSERTGAFQPVAPRGHRLVAGLDLDLPPLLGYLAMVPKPAGELALETPAGDPLLAVRGAGLGTVAAWTSDTGEAWGPEWVSDPAAASFWAAIVRRLARSAGDAAGGVSVTVADGLATIRVDATDEAGDPLDLADVTAVLTATSSAPAAGIAGAVEPATPRRVTLAQVAPGTYEARVQSAIGVTLMAVELAKAGQVRRVDSGWSWNGPEEQNTFTNGAGQLEAVVQAGGGTVLSAVPEALESRPLGTPPWLVFVIAAAVLWLADVAAQLGVRFRASSQRGSAPDWSSELGRG